MFRLVGTHWRRRVCYCVICEGLQRWSSEKRFQIVNHIRNTFDCRNKLFHVIIRNFSTYYYPNELSKKSSQLHSIKFFKCCRTYTLKDSSRNLAKQSGCLKIKPITEAKEKEKKGRSCNAWSTRQSKSVYKIDERIHN